MRYSALVQHGIDELLAAGGRGCSGGSLALACASFGQALEAEAPDGGELKKAMQAVADAAPALAAAVAAAEGIGQLCGFVDLAMLLGQMLALMEVGGGPAAEALAPPLLQLALALVGAPSFEAALGEPEERGAALPLLAIASGLLRQVVGTLAAHGKMRMRYLAQVGGGHRHRIQPSGAACLPGAQPLPPCPALHCPP